MLVVDRINVFYGDLQALWDVSLKVEKGEILALVGSNGAGKTTTLNTISGILKPRSGKIEFMGKRIDGMPPHKIVELGIAQVPEGRQLFPEMTVLENLEMGAYTKRAREKFYDTLEWVYQLFPILKERKNQLAGTLSGGEQQMLAIARALMSRPQLLMLDEPSLGLAPKLVLLVFEMIHKINEEGVTILLVEQNVRHALSIAHRGYVIETGKIVLEGSGQELLENEYVKKAFLGM
ncbi:MAG: ABC transporter ATP-binding protein [Candidatus Methanomethylicota archaeon]|uniref:ABC transporter ATP-binding protein n=1 Tax=Thermoproteota archaeon TaxID=2056631 RepID=A0A497EUZ4_9CREN|nr:MAG: ABC transporter ATP-binding protein [Candidatus Verstraetearchaeota archaeon]